MTPDEAVKHVWLAGHANQIANMVNMSISGKQDSRKGTTKSIQSLTVRQIETGIGFCYTILLQSIPFIVNASVQQKVFTCAGYSL
jgi:hypothetical protein